MSEESVSKETSMTEAPMADSHDAEKEMADKQRGEKIVTIQAVYRDAQSRPVWRWEEDAKTVFWRAVQGNNSTLSHMAVFSQGFPWQPPASWKIC